MIIYSVTVKVFIDIHKDWLQWMKETHIPNVMKTGFFKECRMSKILEDDESQGMSYNMQYLCESYSDLMEYQEKHSPALQKEHTKRYEGKFVAFRTLLKLKEEFKR
jgi:hypothetical protein